MTLIQTALDDTVVRLSVVDDPVRLGELARTGLLDQPADDAFDRLTRLATRMLRAPVSLVSLVDRDRQFFKSAVGLDIRETPLSHSFCQYAVATGEPLVINDARATPLVQHNLAIRDLGVIAYAGIPLVTSRGHILGSFCVIDSAPRQWTEEEIATLRDLAALVTTEIEYRLKLLEVSEMADIGLRLEAPLADLSDHLQSALRLLNDSGSVDAEDGATEAERLAANRERMGHFAMLADGRVRVVEQVLADIRSVASRPAPPDPSFTVVDITRPVVRAVTAASVVARTSAIRLTVEDQPLPALCDARTLEHSVTHLLLSALRHAEGLADIGVALTRRTDVGELSVMTSAVIPPGDLAKILGRFYHATCEIPSQRAESRLAFRTVRRGLEAENGPLHARSAHGEGTRFTLRLPLSAVDRRMAPDGRGLESADRG